MFWLVGRPGRGWKELLLISISPSFLTLPVVYAPGREVARVMDDGGG